MNPVILEVPILYQDFLLKAGAYVSYGHFQITIEFAKSKINFVYLLLIRLINLSRTLDNKLAFDH